MIETLIQDHTTALTKQCELVTRNNQLLAQLIDALSTQQSKNNEANSPTTKNPTPKLVDVEMPPDLTLLKEKLVQLAKKQGKPAVVQLLNDFGANSLMQVTPANLKPLFDETVKRLQE